MEVSECDVGRRFVPEEFKAERVVAETQGDDDGAFPGKSPRGARLRDGGRGRRAAGVGVYIMLSMLKRMLMHAGTPGSGTGVGLGRMTISRSPVQVGARKDGRLCVAGAIGGR